MTYIMKDIETWNCLVIRTIRNKERKFEVIAKEYSTSTKDSWDSDRLTIEVKNLDENFYLSPTLKKSILREGLKKMFASNAGAWQEDAEILCV